MDYKDAPPYLKKAIEKYYKSEYKSAIEYFQKSIDQENINKYIGEIYFKKIACYIYLKKLNEAKEEYNKFSRNCSIDKNFDIYYQIIDLFNKSRLAPFALFIVQHLISKTSFPQPEHVIEHAKCLLILNRLVEAEYQIEEALKILKKYGGELSWNFLLTYCKIKNSIHKFTDTIDIYYQYKSANLKDRIVLFHPQIFLLVGIAFIELNRFNDLTDEIIAFFFKNYNQNQSTCYITYLQSYKKLYEHKSIEGHKEFSKIIDKIESHRLNKDIFEEDISLFYELKGDLLDNITNNCLEAIYNYYLCISSNTESIVRIYNKIAVSFIHDYEDSHQERMLKTKYRKITYKLFADEIEELHRESQSYNFSYNLYLLKLYQEKLNYIFRNADFKLLKNIIEYIQIDFNRNKISHIELIKMLEVYFYYIRISHNNFIDQFYLYPRIIYSKGKYAKIYSGEQSRENVAIKFYKLNMKTISTNINQQKKLKTAFMEIITMQKIFEYFKSTDPQLKENDFYLLPIKTVYILNNKSYIYLVTPLYNGGDLYDLVINKKVTLSLNQIKNILISIAKAINILHLLNMVHKDIRSKNIYIKEKYKGGDNLQVCLGGLDMVGKTDIFNDISYNVCAPELLISKSDINNKEIDIYSFGMLIWELCLKESPYEGLTKEEIIKQRNQNIELDHNKLKENIVEDLYILFVKCTNNEPSQRPSIQQVIDDLNNIYI